MLSRSARIAALRAAPLHIAAVSLHGDLLHRQCAHTERDAKAGSRILKVDDAFGVGHLVNAVHARNSAGFNPPRNALICAQHKFFNQAVGPGTLCFADAAHRTLLIEVDHRLWQVKIDRAATDSLAIQTLG